jgi:hypothetical protein
MSFLFILNASSLFIGLGLAQTFNEETHNNVCINYSNYTGNNSYYFEKLKLEHDFNSISNALFEYYNVKDRADCTMNCNVTVNLVTKNYLNSNFSNWTTGSFINGNYSITSKHNSGQITGLYVFDKPTSSHTIYLTDTGSPMYNYGIMSHEIAHYWFKRKCFNEGYYNEMNAINFHTYIMSNYNYLLTK